MKGFRSVQSVGVSSSGRITARIIPTRCPPCKKNARNAARRASYHKAKAEAGKKRGKKG